MAGAGTALPASIEVDSASKCAGSHASISNREYASSGNPTNNKLALVDVIYIAYPAHDVVHILDRPLEASHSYFRVAGIAGAIESQTLAVDTT